MELKHLIKIILVHLSTAILSLKFSGIFSTLADVLLSLRFLLCSMSPCTVDLDDRTTMHFWVTNHRQFNRPNLVLIHGYGGVSLAQFFYQVGPLSKAFNLYIPDLIFFGKSLTKLEERTDSFQAKCVREGLKKLGVEKYSLLGVSYGGFVTYKVAENYAKEVEKVVIISCGICYTEEQRKELLGRLGRKNICDLLLARKPQQLRRLIKLSMYKTNPLKWVPDFVLRDWIKVMGNNHRKEKLELVEYLMDKKADTGLPVLSQETLLIWGDQDNVFPVYLAHQLQRHLGSKSRVEIIKDTGHAVNLECPDVVNRLITSFVSGGQS